MSTSRDTTTDKKFHSSINRDIFGGVGEPAVILPVQLPNTHGVTKISTKTFYYRGSSIYSAFILKFSAISRLETLLEAQSFNKS